MYSAAESGWPGEKDHFVVGVYGRIALIGWPDNHRCQQRLLLRRRSQRIRYGDQEYVIAAAAVAGKDQVAAVGQPGGTPIAAGSEREPGLLQSRRLA